MAKKIFFAFIPFVVLLLALEIGLRCIYYQRDSRYYFAIRDTFSRLQHRFLRFRAAAVVEKLPKVTVNDLFSPPAKELLEDFQKRYETELVKLLQGTKHIQSKFLMVYIPSQDCDDLVMMRKFRDLYEKIAAKYDIDFVDTTDELLKYPVSYFTLLPENGHLSRLGNQIIAEVLSKYIDTHNSYRSSFVFKERPTLFGDLKPSQSSIWEIMPAMPYRVITNSQGLRMTYDLSFPKTKQRILVLGDSFTFGPYLDNHDTYPALLNAKYPDKEVINAGVCGYSIIDETGLFLERAKYVEPDITILQVLDNDLAGFFYFKQNQYDRHGREHFPTDVEKRFLENRSKK